jgi:ArsR family transcriptional regulator
VTIDYAHTEDFLFRNFPCVCGAPNCRKTVLGRRQIMTPEVEAQVARIEGRRGEVLPLTARVSPPMDLFEILADSTRRKILSLLREDHLRSVDLAATMRTGYSAVSYHLRILRQAGLVTQYRQGRILLYALDDQRLQIMLEESRSHVEDWSNQFLIQPVPRRKFAPRERYHQAE